MNTLKSFEGADINITDYDGVGETVVLRVNYWSADLSDPILM